MKLDNFDKELLRLILVYRFATAKTLAEFYRAAESTIRGRLNRLVKRGLLSSFATNFDRQTGFQLTGRGARAIGASVNKKWCRPGTFGQAFEQYRHFATLKYCLSELHEEEPGVSARPKLLWPQLEKLRPQLAGVAANNSTFVVNRQQNSRVETLTLGTGRPKSIARSIIERFHTRWTKHPKDNPEEFPFRATIQNADFCDVVILANERQHQSVRTHLDQTERAIRRQASRPKPGKGRRARMTHRQFTICVKCVDFYILPELEDVL